MVKDCAEFFKETLVSHLDEETLLVVRRLMPHVVMLRREIERLGFMNYLDKREAADFDYFLDVIRGDVEELADIINTTRRWLESN